MKKDLLKTRRRYVDARKHNAILILATPFILNTSFNLLRMSAKASEFVSPAPSQELTVVEKLVPVEVVKTELVPVTQRTYGCFKARPEVVERIKAHFGDEWLEAVDLYCRESGLNHQAVNPSSGACGIVQSLPCEKMKCGLNDLECQLTWGKKYIKNRYGTVKKALQHHDLKNWY